MGEEDQEIAVLQAELKKLHEDLKSIRAMQRWLLGLMAAGLVTMGVYRERVDTLVKNYDALSEGLARIQIEVALFRPVQTPQWLMPPGADGSNSDTLATEKER